MIDTFGNDECLNFDYYTQRFRGIEKLVSNFQKLKTARLLIKKCMCIAIDYNKKKISGKNSMFWHVL